MHFNIIYLLLLVGQQQVGGVTASGKGGAAAAGSTGGAASTGSGGSDTQFGGGWRWTPSHLQEIKFTKKI